ncbi:MAG: response regulator [Desulfuromonadaceae bacterium]|nr:response regulator [Desulfuromonadaceae bacterium]MDD2848071.1 response regulator [Desulfuromonadaceae bacterium]MDD4132088.1 response regulator [Desulfuromonadaceae bacterium]
MIETQEKIRTVLIVDDTPANVLLLESILSQEYTTRAATRGSEALEIALTTIPDLILLDIMLPDIDGYEVCRSLKSNPVTCNIPVIFITAMHSAGNEALGFEAGGADYITKPFVNMVVVARVKAHLALIVKQEGLEEWNNSLINRVWHNIATIREKNEALQRVESLKTEIEDDEEYAEGIIETIREPFMVVSSRLNILKANSRFYETFKITPEKTLGNSIYDIDNRQWDIPEIRLLFEEILLNQSVCKDYEVDHVFQSVGRKIILINARSTFRKQTGSEIILLAIEDITERRMTEEFIKSRDMNP